MRYNNGFWRVILFGALPILFTCFIVANNALAAISPEVEWENTMGGKQADRGFSALQTPDGGYIVVGETYSSSARRHGAGGYDAYLVKLDAAGQKRGKHTYGGSKNDSGAFVARTTDGGLIITGTTQSYSEDRDKQVFLVKTNDRGEKQWRRALGGAGEDTGACVDQTADGGYIVVGETNSFGAGDYDVYLIKTDASGKVEWEKTFGGKEDDHGTWVRQTGDKGYILAGKTASFGVRGYDAYLVKIGPNGDTRWETTVGGEGWDIPEVVEQTSDGGYIVVGKTSSFQSGNFDIHLIKIDSSGNIQWENAIGGKGWDIGKTVRQTVDGGYVVAGFSNSSDAGEFEFYLAGTDAGGKKLWEKTLEEGEYDERFSVRCTEDGGYIIAGWWEDHLKSWQRRKEDVQVYVVRIKAELPPANKKLQAGPILLDVPVIMKNGHILAPVGSIAQPLGIKAHWDRDTRIITLTAGEREVKLKTGAHTALVNGEPVEINEPVFTDKGYIYVPLEFVAEFLGAAMTWNEVTNTVSIDTAP
ncbi:MAG: copper amine oxidase N-terminal domain-containing protein [Firmicutes bacterium]|nr:copper amine oxidase N-terminal domain-containing protein [Bacillota bacterium]